MADERMGSLAAQDDYAPDEIIPPPYRAPGQGSMAAQIGAAILTRPLRAAMYPGQVWRGEANPYEGTDAADWAAGMALSNVARGGRAAPEGALGAGGGKLIQPGPPLTGEILSPSTMRPALGGVSAQQQARLGPMLEQLGKLGASSEQIATFTPEQAYNFIKARNSRSK